MAVNYDNLPTPRPRPLLGKNLLLYLVNKYIDKLQHIHWFEDDIDNNNIIGGSSIET